MVNGAEAIAAGRQKIAEQRAAFIEMAKKALHDVEGYSEADAAKYAVLNAPTDETSLFTQDGDYMVGNFSGTKVKVAKDLYPTVFAEPVSYHGVGYEGGVDGKRHTIVLADGTKFTFPHKPSDKQSELKVEMRTDMSTIDEKTGEKIPHPHLQVDANDFFELHINSENAKSQDIIIDADKSGVAVKKDNDDCLIFRGEKGSYVRIDGKHD